MYDKLCRQLRAMASTWGISLPREAADAIEELSNAQEKWIEQERNALLKSIPRWIPVTEWLPEEYEQVLTCDEHENIHIMSHTKRYKYPFGINPEHPRYFMPKWWMPLPEPPKAEEGET